MKSILTPPQSLRRHRSLFTHRAFTLIELLVVITIIVLVAGLLMPAATFAIKTAKFTKSTGQFKNISVGLSSYIGDNDQRFPYLYTGNWGSPYWHECLMPYLTPPVPDAAVTGSSTSPTLISPLISKGFHHGLSDYGANPQVFTLSSYVAVSPATIANPSQFAVVMMAGSILGGKHHGTWFVDANGYTQNHSITTLIPWDHGSGKILMLFADGHIDCVSSNSLYRDPRPYLLPNPNP